MSVEAKDKERMTGTTTRLADFFVQELFTKGEIHVVDHYNTLPANHYLLNILVRRLQFEHSRTKFRVEGLTIKLIK